MFEIGSLCVKIAGRDSGKKAIVIDILENNYVLIDGQVRRKKCNIKHLEPLNKVLKIKKNASHEEVVDLFKKENIEIIEKKQKTKAETKKQAIEETNEKVQKKEITQKKKKTEKTKN